MLWFAFLVAVLLAVALLLLLPPLLGLAGRAAATNRFREQTVRALLREELVELQDRRASAEIGETEYRRAEETLYRRVLEEGRPTAAASVDARPARSWAVLLATGIPVGVMSVYLWLGAPAGMNPGSTGFAEKDVQAFAPEQLNSAVGELVARLEDEPADPSAWIMLARSYLALGDPGQAVDTWARLGKNVPPHADVLTEWAKVLATAQGGTFEGEPLRLIRAALEVSSKHFEALYLAARIAHDRGEFTAATGYWKRLLEQIPSSSASRAIVSEHLDRALAGVEPAMPGLSESDREATAKLQLRGTVRLSSALADRVRPGDTVFVYASPVDGGMPLAAQRYSAAQLPLEFDLADGMRMPGGPLPARLVVTARITSGGDARARAGELEGVSVPVPVTASDVRLVIDRVRE